MKTSSKGNCHWDASFLGPSATKPGRPHGVMHASSSSLSWGTPTDPGPPRPPTHDGWYVVTWSRDRGMLGFYADEVLSFCFLFLLQAVKRFRQKSETGAFFWVFLVVVFQWSFPHNKSLCVKPEQGHFYIYIFFHLVTMDFHINVARKLKGLFVVCGKHEQHPLQDVAIPSRKIVTPQKYSLVSWQLNQWAPEHVYIYSKQYPKIHNFFQGGSDTHLCPSNFFCEAVAVVWVKKTKRFMPRHIDATAVINVIIYPLPTVKTVNVILNQPGVNLSQWSLMHSQFTSHQTEMNLAYRIKESCPNNNCSFQPSVSNQMNQIQSIIKFYPVYSTVEYSCVNDSFQIKGTPNVTCLHSGEWSELPVCENRHYSVNYTSFLISILVFPSLAFVAYTLWLWCRRRDKSPKQRRRNKKFDALVSCNFGHDRFVAETLIPKFEENQDPPFKLNYHERDFYLGAKILDNIQDAIENSNSAIFLICQRFVDSI